MSRVAIIILIEIFGKFYEFYEILSWFPFNRFYFERKLKIFEFLLGFVAKRFKRISVQRKNALLCPFVVCPCVMECSNWVHQKLPESTKSPLNPPEVHRKSLESIKSTLNPPKVPESPKWLRVIHTRLKFTGMHFSRSFLHKTPTLYLYLCK